MHRRPETTESKQIIRTENRSVARKGTRPKEVSKKTWEAPGADNAKIGSLLLLPRNKQSNMIARPTYNRLVSHCFWCRKLLLETLEFNIPDGCSRSV